MNLKEFKQAGHWPTLLSAFLYFDVSFMVWVMLGPLSLYITKDLALPLEEKFTIVAIPILSGAVFRIILGSMADHIGPKLTGILAQLLVILGLAYVFVFGLHSKLEVEILGLLLGVAGASFAVALPQASRWYPPKFQGVVMGIAGAGNMGVVLDSMIVPWLAEKFGWQAVFGFLLIPLVIVLIVYAVLVKDAPDKRTPVTLANYAAVMKDPDAWWFMFFYSITFGGFVGLGNALPLYFTNWYHVSGIAAGMMVAIVVFAGSMFRPVGGYLADRIGGIRALQVLFVVVSLSYLAISFMPEGPVPQGLGNAKVAGWGLWELPAEGWGAVAIFFAGTLALGMGNGSVFQLVPLRFRKEIGVVTGLVGCAGGVGGFFLAKTLGLSWEIQHGFALGFSVFAVLPLLGLGGLVMVRKRWRTTWGAVSGAQV
ncbi:nitrate/nitrite transporter [Methylococcus geothermalis]|uniref:MFS transporter n=1 Tax=Methylococcus geothermalis TaxID=2681310 RepID=A0A858QB47_9GAMM|nr:nitrate/nitrite transporter [Methylococcus geothermalis]QJD31162.1 MFS transporter [Methylococcus geothermalis]